MAQYLRKQTTKAAAASTPQSEALPGTTQERNDAGGFAWRVDNWKQLDRFLISGTEGGTYYATEQKLTKRNVASVDSCIKEDGLRVVSVITAISDGGRAPSNDPALFALAKCAAATNLDVRKAALAALPKVARTGTHLHHFIAFLDGERGWGRSVRRAVSNWFTKRSAESIAYQALKYPSRDGWSMKDALRLAHPEAPSLQHEAVFRYIQGGITSLDERTVSRRTKTGEVSKTYPSVREELPAIIEAVEEVRKISAQKIGAGELKHIISLIEAYGLSREMLPTELLNEIPVWEALLQHMPPEACIRNLGVMTAKGVIKDLSANTKRVIEIITDAEQLKAKRVHPLKVLVGYKTYMQGKGLKGSLTWQPVRKVGEALDDGFYLAIDVVEPTNMPSYFAVDCSGSMFGGRAGNTPLTPAEAAAAFLMVGYRTEPVAVAYGFGTSMIDIKINTTDRLDVVLGKIQRVPWSGTDCAKPMLDAAKRDLEVDNFLVFTDNETWAGHVHPNIALQQYRAKSGRAAKLVTFGFTGGSFTIADPNDAGMLDVVGLDTDVPAIVNHFLTDGRTSAQSQGVDE